ncbi:MAG: hypothetical protein ACOC44_20430 [Promethearchaeia archaeon]
MEFTETEVLKILALALPNDTPDHRLKYLLNKLYGYDHLSLDSENQEFLERIMKQAAIIQKGE